MGQKSIPGKICLPTLLNMYKHLPHQAQRVLYKPYIHTLLSPIKEDLRKHSSYNVGLANFYHRLILYPNLSEL